MSDTEQSTGNDKKETVSSKLKIALTALKNRRTVCEQQIERTVEFLNKIKVNLKLTSATELNIRLKALEDAFRNFSNVQLKIEEKSPDEIGMPDRSTYEEMYFSAASSMKVFIQQLENKTHSSNSLDETLQRERNFEAIKLPKIELQVFKGEVTTWMSWYDEFISLVHNNQSYTTLAKFHHLIAGLGETAKATIEGLKIVSENYEVALKRLRERFENKKVIGKRHIELMFQFQKVNKANPVDLRNLIDQMNNHLTGLKKMNRPVDQWDDLIVYLITTKLDTETALKWNEESATDRMPTLTELMTFLKKRCQILEGNVQTNLLTHMNPICSTKREQRNTRSKVFANVESSCIFCHKRGHFIYRCIEFLNLPIRDRIQKIRDMKLCENCLKTNNHKANNCTSTFKCHTCGNKHHSLLHQTNNNPTAAASLLPPCGNIQAGQSSSVQPSTSSAVVLHHKSTERNILGTVIVDIINKYNQNIPCRALLDSGSQLNMISERIVKLSGLQRQSSLTQFSCVNNTNIMSKFKSICTIKSGYNNFSITFEALVMKQITGNLPENKFPIEDWNIPVNINLSDPLFNTPQKIDMLIGVDVFYDILSIGQIKLGIDLPIAQNTLFGWVIAGRLPNNSSINSSLCSFTQFTSSDDKNNIALNESIKAFWNIEELNVSRSSFTTEERECEMNFVNTTIRVEGGRYQVTLPFKYSPSSLGASYDTALKRFCALERKFRKNKDLKQQYEEFMNEYIHLGHMEPVVEIDCKKSHYIIPHHCVFKPSSSTTKIRVVFDASSKSSSGVSLNDLLMVGPVIQPDLFSIALRFRFYTYVFTSDIGKMYRQVLLDPNHRRYHCILWRPSENEPVKIYQLCTVTYGTASASFLATRALQQLSVDERNSFPLAATATTRDFYVDDILSGANTIDEAAALQNQLKSMLIRGGFELKKWCANHEALIENIPEEDREKFFEIKGENAIKALGMVWNPSIDKFLYNKNLPSNITSVTKRSVLSEIAQFFDPLGLINPVVVLAKLFMQQLWRLNLDWDASLPQEYYSRWMHFREQLHYLNDFEIDRQAFFPNANYELHAFCDSSENAYGACLYVRSISCKGDILAVKLLCAKSRVAPIKSLCLPRLELCGAVTAAQLVQRAIGIFDFVKFQNIMYWTDSTIVLNWLREESCNWQTFIANRVALIQDTSEFSQWRHIPTELNPADILSRGAQPLALINCKLWYCGPNFLMEPNSLWPAGLRNVLHDDNILERKKTKIILMSRFDKTFIENIKYYNNYKKLLNIIAYMFRFKHNFLVKNKDSRLSGILASHELHNALTAIIRSTQQSEFASEIKAMENDDSLPKKSNIQPLSPFIDEKGIVRVGGRLNHSALDFNSKHPILLPRVHVFTRSLLIYYHNVNHHAGPQTLLSIVSQTYWPIHGKVIARSVVHNCVRCSRAKPMKNNQLMGDLPELRVQQARPFNIVGVDFCGPFYTHFRRRGTSPVKSYVAVFICFVTKAIHLELVEDLSTKGFLDALKRFIGRRGRCAVIYSDNATNFVGARNELNDLFEMFRKQQTQDKIKSACAEDGIAWKHIPPRSPHFGGLWEAAVKSFKFHLKRILQNASLTFSEFNTLIIQIESVLNSRPITPVPESPNDAPALTPGHFIIGTALNALPGPDFQDVENVNRLQRYQQLQWYLQQFWKRWNKEYLQSLQVRSKWSTPAVPISIGDVVILQEDGLPPLQWKLGRITQLHPGKDGITRVVTVKTASGEVQRATTKIRRLPVENPASSQGGVNVKD